MTSKVSLFWIKIDYSIHSKVFLPYSYRIIQNNYNGVTLQIRMQLLLMMMQPLLFLRSHRQPMTERYLKFIYYFILNLLLVKGWQFTVVNHVCVMSNFRYFTT